MQNSSHQQTPLITSASKNLMKHQYFFVFFHFQNLIYIIYGCKLIHKKQEIIFTKRLQRVCICSTSESGMFLFLESFGNRVLRAFWIISIIRDLTIFMSYTGPVCQLSGHQKSICLIFTVGETHGPVQSKRKSHSPV